MVAFGQALNFRVAKNNTGREGLDLVLAFCPKSKYA